LHNEATKLILNRRHSATVGRHRNCSIVPLLTPGSGFPGRIPGQVNVLMMSPLRLPTSLLSTMHSVAKDDDVLAPDILRGPAITGRWNADPIGKLFCLIKAAGCLANWNLLWRHNYRNLIFLVIIKKVHT